MTSRRSFLSVALLLTGGLPLIAACTPPPPPSPDYTQIGFGHRSPLRLNVARVVFRDESRQPREAPEVGHLFPDPPATVVERWVRDRLQAVGSTGEIEAVLREASVTETTLPRSSGLRGLVTREQSERYDARIALTLRARNARGEPDGSVEVRLERSTTVRENLGRGERTAIWHRLMEEMARSLDEEMERAIRDGDLARLLA